ncbi:MAG: tetratricopeptide repeat protein [Flavobacteriales bacterium]
MRILIFWFCLAGLFSNFFSQGTAHVEGKNASFYRGEELFDKKQYAAARITFDQYLKEQHGETHAFRVKASYLHALSALNLFHGDAEELMTNHLVEFPETPYKTAVYIALGNLQFDQENYLNAVSWYSKASLSDVDSVESMPVYFKMGYAHFKEQQMTEALACFSRCIGNKNDYRYPSLYYLGHIYFAIGNYSSAKTPFLTLNEAGEYPSIVPYYLVQIYHAEQEWQTLISYILPKIESGELEYKSEILHFLGDAFYQQGLVERNPQKRTSLFNEAAKYLTTFGTNAKTTREDQYTIGYSLLSSNRPEEAITYFEKAARIDDSLGQNAMYQIGVCYLNQKKMPAARNAFERASKMKSLPIVAEDALYQCALISFSIDINPYDESVRAFEKYMEQYPESKRKNEVYQFLITVYASTSNFKKALEFLNKIPNKNLEQKSLYQTTAFNLGVEYLEKDQLDSAKRSFGLVEAFPMESELIAQSKFWLAEILYRQGEFKSSIAAFKTFLSYASAALVPEKNDAYYSMGHAYLNLNQIPEALPCFTTYIQNAPKEHPKTLDAYFQLADGNYQLGKDEQAIAYYKKIIEIPSESQDRACFYLAKAYGFNKQAQQKISTLETLLSNYKQSKYTQSAIYELGMTYKSEKDLDQAAIHFKDYIFRYPNNSRTINCRIELADIYYKKWDYIKAEEAYKRILSDYGNDNEICALAAKGLMAVYVAQKNPEKAESVADQYACAQVSADDKENLYYNPAFQAYVDSNYSEAAEKFSLYLSKFPAGTFSQDANLYLGNSYYRLKDTAKAVPYFDAYLSGASNTYFEPVSLRLSSYFYGKKSYEKALTYYGILDKYAVKPNNITTAKTGLMRSTYALKKYAESKEYANAVKQITGINSLLLLEAEYVLGTSHYFDNEWNEAKAPLRWVVKNTTTIRSAEARYLLAEIEYKNQALDSANLLAEQLIKMKPSYNYWVAKGLLLQSQIAVDKKDFVEATQTLLSIIEYYPIKTDQIIEQAQNMLDEVEQLKNPAQAPEEKKELKIEIKNN